MPMRMPLTPAELKKTIAARVKLAIEREFSGETDIRVQDISPLEVSVRVIPGDSGPRYYRVKVSEAL